MNDEDRVFDILIIDDVPKNIQVVAGMLEDQGYNLAFAGSGEEALKKIVSHDFDLILLDIMMQGIDGFEVCRRIKENPETRNIPIIFLTARTDTESIVKGFNTGAVDYVTKPFNAAELTARVKTHIELSRSRERLRVANATKDKFFSIIAHDLKNPFNALYGLSDLFLRLYDKHDDQKKKDLVTQIRSSSEKAYKLLQNLLDWSRMQTGSIKFHPKNIDLYPYVLESIMLLQATADKKQIRLKADMEKGTTVFGDPDMISMVIRNLISNALKFTQPQGRVEISSHSEQHFEYVHVSDNGIGMSPDTLSKLFRIDVHPSTLGTEDEKGTGLGLILCQEFVKRNGGDIQVDSTPGKGSVFTFTIPKIES